MTFTVADLEILLPVPVHEREYVVVAVGATDCVPEIAFVPVQPPEAVHDATFVELHESVDDCPLVMDVGDAEKVSVGAGGG